MRLYPEYKMFWTDRMLAQRVVLRWAGCFLIVHPELKKMMRRMYYGHFVGGRSPDMTAGRMSCIKDNLVHWGLGVTIRDSGKTRAAMERKFRYVGLVQACEGSRDWVVPKETISKWIEEGRFVLPTQDVIRWEVAASLESAGLPEIAEALRKKMSAEKAPVPVGTYKKPARSTMGALGREGGTYRRIENRNRKNRPRKGSA